MTYDYDDDNEPKRVKFIRRPCENDDYSNTINYCANFVYDPVQVAYTMVKNEDLKKQNQQLKTENSYLQNHIYRIELDHKREKQKMEEERKEMNNINNAKSAIINSRINKLKEEWKERELRLRMEMSQQKREERDANRQKEENEKILAQREKILNDYKNEMTTRENKHKTAREEMRNYIEFLNSKQRKKVQGYQRHLDNESKTMPRSYNFILFFAIILFVLASCVLFYLIYYDDFVLF